MQQRVNVQYIRLYTVGSAALKLQSAAPQSEFASQKMPQKAKRIKLFVDPVAMLSILVALSMLVLMSVGFAQLRQTRTELATMEAYVERLETENAALSNEYKSGYNLDQVLQAALEMQMIPAEQAARVDILIPAEPEPVQQISLWQRIGTFLTGLFA